MAIIAGAAGVVALGVAKYVSSNAGAGMKTETVHVVIDNSAVMGATDAFSLIEPLWERVDIYDSWSKYEATLRPFTTSQRHLFAIQWYRSEVSNGGHDQFFFNSTGIVWEHAVAGLEAVGVPEGADILRAASQRLGGASRDRELRQQQLDGAGADFEDLDRRFFELDGTGALDDKMLVFARQHPSDFHFEGDVKRVVLPSATGKPSN